MGLGYNEKEFFNIPKGKIGVPIIKTRKFNGKKGKPHVYLKTYISNNTAQSRKKTLKKEGYSIRITKGKQQSGANKGKPVYRVWGTLWKKVKKN